MDRNVIVFIFNQSREDFNSCKAKQISCKIFLLELFIIIFFKFEDDNLNLSIKFRPLIGDLNSRIKFK